MNESFEQLENDIDATLAEWSDALNVVPPEVATEQARMAAHVVLHEPLLAEAVTPSAEILQRVRDKVHAELAVGQGRRWFLSAPAVGAWSAAALIAICFGLIYYSGATGSGGSTAEDMIDDVVIERFIAVNEPLMSEPALTSSISSELDTLEESISTWQPIWTDLDQLFESLDTETGDQSRGQDTSAEHMALQDLSTMGVMG